MPDRGDWFSGSWGLLVHYLGKPEMPADEWNRRIDAFDVAALTDQLATVGAKHFFITIGQNSGHYCAPNATFDRLTDITPSKCSRRDLVADLARSLSARGIRLLVYLPSGAPDKDAVALTRLGWEPGTPEPWTLPAGQAHSKRLPEFQRNWELIIREWSQRWGSSINGWWIDGCYYADDMYRHSDEPNFRSFAAALRSGNQNSLVAFNSGKSDAVIHSEEDDYTAGEVSHWFPVCYRRWVNEKGHRATFHVLSFVGHTWGGSALRFPDEFVTGYTKLVTRNGGAVTWDVPADARGIIPDHCIRQLQGIGKNWRG